MKRRPRIDLTRRGLLQALGLGAAAGPLIPLLNAEAQTATRPKRLLLVFTPDGAPAKDYSTTVDWKPTGTEAAFTLHMIHAPLQPFASKMVVPWGLTQTAGGAGEAHAYGMAGLWTATTLPGPGSGASFDGGNGNLTGWGPPRRSIRSSRRRSDRTCPTSGPPTTPIRRRSIDRSPSACSARDRARSIA